MAYGVKYRFHFESIDGADYTIDILKNGYTGSVLTRAMGGAPTLRRDMNDCINGTSLDFIAECSVDSEYEEFGQSDPFTFKVEVYNYQGQEPVWQGFVSPEIYRAPDIAPPYDINITATDGLGELKLNYFEAQGLVALDTLLSYLLSFTGLSLDIVTNLDYYISGSSAAYFLSDVSVNMDHLDGKTCYDVLQAVLTSFHLTVTQGYYGWIVSKETAVTLSGSNITYRNGSTSVGYPAFHFGSMGSHGSGFWPVGHMTREYVPARKRMVLTSNNHYNSNILTGTWTTGGGASSTSTYYSLPISGGIISQTHTYFTEIRQDLVLTINVRNVGSGSTDGTLGVYVIAKNSSLSYYLTNQGSTTTEGKPTWSLADSYCAYELPAPATSDTDSDYTTVEIVVPLYNIGIVATALEVRIFNNDALYPKRVYDVALYKRLQFEGFKKIVSLDNGSRGDASDVELAVTGLPGSNDYSGIEELQDGIMRASSGHAKIATLSTGKFSGLEYLSLMARDYALSYVSPRVRLSGVLSVPTSTVYLPGYFIDDFDSTLYIVETFSWDLYHDECTVQMISLPAASITVEEESIEEIASTDASKHSSSSGGSGGGGGGGGTGTVTSVALTMPSQFDVSGSPVTSAGTLAVTLNSNYVIPTAGRMAILDDITTTMINHWELAYQQSHTHSNLTALNTITAAKIAAWDAAAGGGLSPSDIGIPAPTVKIMNADGTSGTAIIRIWHPLLAYSTDAEVVLMTKARKTQKKVGTAQTESSNLHYPRKGWMVAKTYTGGRTYTFTVRQGAYGAIEALSGMLTYIARYYTRVGTKTRAQMASMSYATWKAYGGAQFGWEKTSVTPKNCLRKKFGVAVRFPNPVFDNGVSSQMTLSEHTQELTDADGNAIPRYLYSAVAPILVQITDDNSGMRLGVQVL